MQIVSSKKRVEKLNITLEMADGMVIGNKVGCSTLKAVLLSPLQEGQYVEMDHQEHRKKVLARITRTQRVAILEEKELNGIENLQLSLEDVLVAELKVVGFNNGSSVGVPSIPFRQGDPIHRASDDLLISILSKAREGMYIGKIVGTEVKMKLGREVIPTHTSVLGGTGSGKTHQVFVLTEELIDNVKEYAVLILDAHGEYHSLTTQAELSLKTEEFGVIPKSYEVVEYTTRIGKRGSSEQIQLPARLLSAEDYLSMTLGMDSARAKTLLQDAISRARGLRKDVHINDIIENMEDDDVTGNALKEELKELTKLRFLSRKEMRFSDVLKKGRITIFNLKYLPRRAQELLVHHVVRELWTRALDGTCPPVVIVVEEAHRFCPQQGKAASSEILRTIASEGRKFKMGLVLSSQRPARVDKSVLSQCGCQIVFRMTNVNDLRAVEKSMEGADGETVRRIQSLPTGWAIVSSRSTIEPICIEVRPRKSGG